MAVEWLLMPAPTVAALRSLLLETVDTLANRSLDMWSPSFGPCKARDEASETAAYTGDGGLPWGDGPLGFVWRGGKLLYTAVLEHVRAAATLMEAPHRFWSAAVLARVAVEAAAQARWLLDADVPTGRIRVGRYYTMYLHSSGQLEYTHGQIRIGKPLDLYGRSRAHMAAEAIRFGLVPVTNTKGDILGFEGQKWPRKTNDMVAEIIGDGGGYSVLSGASHAEFWSLMSAFREGEPSPFGVSQDLTDSELESYKLVSRACMNAMSIPALEVIRLFGRSTLANDLLSVGREARPLLGQL